MISNTKHEVMKVKILHFFFLTVLICLGCSTDENSPLNPEIEPAPTGMYFPPIDSNDWETVSPAQLEWNEDKVDDLYEFLDTKKTKGFLVLQNGRIVMEKYFNGHNQNAKWTWYSAAKSLTATFVGVAQDEGLIDINNRTSDYLGTNWSQLSMEQQNQITVKHHLSMSTGLTDNVDKPLEWICTLPICMTYTTDPGTRWAYHQGAFMLLQEMISQNSGMTFKEYCKTKVADKIGMEGNWTGQLGLNVYNTNTRGMARFGLLALNKGSWNETIIVNETYFNEMIETSQNQNKSYGYLWWLNGKESHMGTTSQDVIQGMLIPNASADLFAALGANDQKIYVVPSKGLVVIRTGESAGAQQLGLSSFDNELWGKLSAVIN